jgi:ATP-dependent RNA helicase DeaD
MAGRDIVGQSQTGSGKTAAFGIPAIEKVDTHKRAVQVLILCPTRELAVQVSEELHKLAFFKRGIHALPIYGGQSYDRQIYGLKQGAQIVIGTPGRLMDHMRRGTLRLDQVRFVVLDEADTMLDMGFRDDIEIILKAVPAERQTVFFSATMSRVIQELIKKYARDPQNVRIEQKALTVPTVEQTYYEVDRRFKIDLLTRLIDIHDLKLGIIFCNTKRMVDDLVEHLNAQGYSADRLHGDMSQALRDRVMNRFRKSGLEFLVATDVAARGIDVDDVQVVFNYDLPYDVEDYVHRIGRTGRAGRSGRAISFVAGREVFQIRNIERYTNTRIQRAKIPTQTEVEEARTSLFLDNLRAILQAGDFKPQDRVLEVLLEEGFSSTDVAAALIHQLQSQENRAADSRAPDSPPARRDVQSGNERAPFRQATDRPRREDRPRPNGPIAQTQRESRPVANEKAMPFPPAKNTTIAPIRSPIAADEPEVKTKMVPEFPATPPRRTPPPSPSLKVSRRTPEGQTRLHMSVGTENGVSREDIVRAIQGETGLPESVIGHVDLRERHTFVDVASPHAQAIVSKLKRTQLADRRLKVKLATPQPEEP